MNTKDAFDKTDCNSLNLCLQKSLPVKVPAINAEITREAHKEAFEKRDCTLSKMDSTFIHIAVCMGAKPSCFILCKRNLLFEEPQGPNAAARSHLQPLA